MKKRIFKTSKNILSLLLCLCMLSGLMTMVACNEDPVEDGDNNNAATTETVEVLRVVDDIRYGGKFTNDKLETVTVRADAVPEGAIADVKEIRTKFAAVPLFAGDYITPAKLLDKKPADAVDEDEIGKKVIDYKALGYVVITDYKIQNPREDYSHVIKRAIEANPGKTIYFPDGEYLISAPIVIPADPAKSVSLRLSNQAVITATSWEDTSVPMIRMGVEDEDGVEAQDAAPTMDEAGLSEQRSTYIIGGCINAAGIASGVSIEGGKDTLLYNLSIKSIADFGIHVHYANNELGATYANVDNVNITGDDSTGSVGVLVDGTYNTFANMRIYRIQYGTYCTETGSNNIFRNLHPLASRGHEDATVSFYDKSNGNNYDICYSDQFSTGFVMHENTRSVYNGSFCYWYDQANGYHVAFRAIGAYNSIWVGGKSAQSSSHVLHTDACMLVCKEDNPDTPDVDESITDILWAPDEEAPSQDVAGKGVVLYPIYANTSQVYNYILKYYSRTEMM
ncbi:MAG: hypothetical protein J6L85_02545 [Clostridia bacterium]|nr:hypothetical protein [Clostridia bacterium]